MFGMILIIIICSLLGMLIFANYHDCDPVAAKIVTSADQLLPLFVVDALRKYPTLPGTKNYSTLLKIFQTFDIIVLL